MSPARTGYTYLSMRWEAMLSMSRAIVRGNEAGPRRAHAEGLGAGGVEH